ncbi:protein of unknown function [Pseudomonas inefficax]|uniref:Uncharacterized protein n=1 Tax=Pseudomonas inefficax TaxID=2078786 RepID=A0AAQ1P629_9PSED|nr:protein of unknown function [Pseudomonas inefficax]
MQKPCGSGFTREDATTDGWFVYSYRKRTK